MRFEFDPDKNAINQAKHGLSLMAARELWNVAGVEADLGLVNKEYRYARLGMMLGKVHIVIFTYRPGPSIRLMSFRLATAKESQYYEQNKKK
jgi:uncharacterized DUF497 family protein